MFVDSDDYLHPQTNKNLYKLLPDQSSKYWMPVSTWGKLFKTKHFIDNKFSHLISEDIVPSYTIVLTKAKKIVFLPKSFYFYRLNMQGISRQSNVEYSKK